MRSRFCCCSMFFFSSVIFARLNVYLSFLTTPSNLVLISPLFLFGARVYLCNSAWQTFSNGYYSSLFYPKSFYPQFLLLKRLDLWAPICSSALSILLRCGKLLKWSIASFKRKTTSFLCPATHDFVAFSVVQRFVLWDANLKRQIKILQKPALFSFQVAFCDVLVSWAVCLFREYISPVREGMNQRF